MPRIPITLTVPTVPTATTVSTPTRGSTLQVRISKGQTHKGVPVSQSVSSSQSFPVSQSVSSSHSVKSDGRGPAVDVYSFGHSVDSVDSIQSKSDLINRAVYYDTRAFIYQIGSQNLSKIKAILILSDVTSVCNYTKLLENI